MHHRRAVPRPTLSTKSRRVGRGQLGALPPGGVSCPPPPPSSPPGHHHLYDHHLYHNQGAGRAASWSKDFDSLLADPNGLQRFTDFLQQEFRFGSLLWVCDYCCCFAFFHYVHLFYPNITLQPRKHCVLDGLRALSEFGGKSGRGETELGQVALFFFFLFSKYHLQDFMASSAC